MYRLHICVACVFQKFTMFDILAIVVEENDEKQQTQY